MSCAHVRSWRRVDVALVQARAQLVLVARPEAVLGEGIDELHRCQRARSISWPRNVDRRRAERLVGDARDEPLDAVHRVAVVGVGLVPLEHRELGVVLERDAFVAEVLADLVDALEPADDQALEVQLGRDPQVERLVELVVVASRTAARTRRRTAAAGPGVSTSTNPSSSSARRTAVIIRARSTKSRACPRSSAGRGSGGGSAARRP